MKESIIHAIKIVGGTRKGIHNTQTRSQNELNLTTIYIAYIAEKWDHNKMGNDKSPQGAEKSPQQYHFFDNLIKQ